MRVLAIDPGVHAHAWALFGQGLLDCGYGDRFPRDVDRLVIEMPRIYPRSRSKGDPNDLVALAYAAGMVVGNLGVKTQIVEPRTWKGTVPKEKRWDLYIIHKRIGLSLTPTESSIYLKALEQVAPSKRHNITDAVGIGLWAHGTRFNKTPTTIGRVP